MVGETLGLLEGVRRHDDRRAGVAQLTDEVPHVEPAVGVEPGDRLVEEEHLGTAEQRGGQGEALLLTAGEPAHGRAREVGHPEARGDRGHVGGLGVEAGEVLEQAHRPRAVGQATALQHHADAGPLVGPGGGRIDVQHAHRARVGAPQPDGALDGGRLAGAVGSQHRGDPARGRLPGQPVERVDGPEASTDVGQSHRCGHG